MKTLFSLLFVIFLVGCRQPLNKDFILKYKWKHDDGASIGSKIGFDSIYYKLKNDTIIKRDTARGVIISLDTARRQIEIKRISDGETGTYHGKNY